MWKEELVDFRLWTQPKASEGDGADCDSEVEQAQEETGVEAALEGHRGWAVQEEQVWKVDQLLSADVYSQRWPKIPKREIRGTSVKHPLLPDAWWLMDTKALSSILNPGQT